ncbi:MULTISPECIES: 3-hydroxybutyrate oligomer hydrolase family protein [Cupriavidus]
MYVVDWPRKNARRPAATGAGASARPRSRAVRAVVRGGMLSPVPALLSINLPPLATVPASADRITVGGGTAEVPNR